MIYESSLYHHGIKGMKWGVRRAQRKFEKNVKRNWWKSYNKSLPGFNKDLASINKKYSDSKFDDDFSSDEGQAYVKEVDTAWRKHYSNMLISDFGPEPVSKGYEWVNRTPYMDSYTKDILR